MFTKKPLQIKRTTVTVKSTPKSSLSPASHSSKKPIAKSSKPRSTATASEQRPRSVNRESPATVAKRKRQQRPTSSTPDFGLDDDSSDGNDDFLEDPAKRQKLDPLQRGLPKRDVRSIAAFKDQGIPLNLVHAAQIPVLDKSTRYEPAFSGLSEDFKLKFQYPSAASRERFALVKPISDSHGYDTSNDITQTMHMIIEYYLPESERHRFDNETSGLPQKFNRAVHKKSEGGIKDVMAEWNSEMTRLREDGTIAKTLDAVESVSPKLAERIINQTFSRTVSLNLKYLHQYEAGTDNVYGELLPKFVSQILRDVRVSSDQVFVDLGSGVGNVVLQAALEAGCESWGCEMMEKYCEVADLQQKEFRARCKLWGLSVGETYLEKGDFLVNAKILEVLKRADVVLVNNQVFTPTLNEALTTLFLDLKDGTKIVSLRSFVPPGHKITARNSDSVLNLLRVEEKEYFSKCVSWTDQGGKYFISTKDSTAVARYHSKNRLKSP